MTYTSWRHNEPHSHETGFESVELKLLRPIDLHMLELRHASHVALTQSAQHACPHFRRAYAASGY